MPASLLKMRYNLMNRRNHSIGYGDINWVVTLLSGEGPANVGVIMNSLGHQDLDLVSTGLYGWRLHDKHRKSKSVYFIYGTCGEGCKFCGGANEKNDLATHVDKNNLF
jgi:hypothetical protein